MPGGVAGAQPTMAAPYADLGREGGPGCADANLARCNQINPAGKSVASGVRELDQ